MGYGKGYYDQFLTKEDCIQLYLALDNESEIMEPSIESDNKVYLDYIEFESHADLYEQIIHDVESLFGVADESDDDEESPSE